MFEQLVATLSRPTALNAFGHAQQMMERTLKLTTSQAYVISGLCDEVGKEYCETLSSDDPSALQKNWSSLMSNAVRANTEAAALLMKNTREFQTEIFRMMPKLQSPPFGQMTIDMMEVAKANGSTRPAARTKMAA